MIDPSLPIRQAYYNQLKNIQYNGDLVPYYSNYIPNNAPDAYIVLTAASIGFNDDKQCLETTAQVTIEAVTVFDRDSNQGATKSELISTEILKKLLPAPGGDFQIDGFQNVDAKLLNSLLLTDQNDTQKIFRKVISIFHILNQIQNG